MPHGSKGTLCRCFGEKHIGKRISVLKELDLFCERVRVLLQSGGIAKNRGFQL